MKYLVWGMTLALVASPFVAETLDTVRPPERRVLISQPEVVTSDGARVVSQPAGDSNALARPNVAGDPWQVVSSATETVDPTTKLPRFFTDIRPPVRSGFLPKTRWQHMRGNEVWTRAALSALKEHGKPLVEMVPGDIQTWCPAYEAATDRDRRAFWVGFLSALAKHESTYKPWVVGGGGRWYGLLQILPGTARGYKCNVGTGEALKNGAANLSCAVRIMAHTVPRDGVIHGYKGGRGRGVTADWGPMHSKAKRGDMARWLRKQNYCKPINATRPRSRP